MDLRLYLITSGTGERTIEVAAQVAEAGAGMVQVRAKNLADGQLAELATKISRAVKANRPTTQVVIDDNVAVAAQLMAAGEHIHGVHLGQDDMNPRQAREILGNQAIIGLTTGTKELVLAANQYLDVVDYLGAGPFRLTPTKDSGRPPLGVAGYPPLVAATKLPIVAIGDITPADVADLSGTGIAGVCMVRALMAADDPFTAAKTALAAFKN
ncbi:MAG: thiamine phosphate synthase [Propionibacterium sp.]|nr:MAG: thiamine phosphate synthase [Propionibacterium sp.]